MAAWKSTGKQLSSVQSSECHDNHLLSNLSIAFRVKRLMFLLNVRNFIISVKLRQNMGIRDQRHGMHTKLHAQLRLNHFEHKITTAHQ